MSIPGPVTVMRGKHVVSAGRATSAKRHSLQSASGIQSSTRSKWKSFMAGGSGLKSGPIGFPNGIEKEKVIVHPSNAVAILPFHGDRCKLLETVPVRHRSIHL